MPVTVLPRILGYNLQCKLTYGAGSITLALWNEISVEENPDKKDADVSASKDKLQVFTKGKAKVTFKGLRGLNQCYSDLPPKRKRITGIEFKYLDEDGEEIEDATDLPDLIRTEDNPQGYILWAVTEKRGKQDDGAGDVEFVLESGIMNAIP